ncbi:unnamed protein product [Rotaria magnacalcarata]|uniref:Uncharacterized protein n=2 Tax=Rotaria magnacalcarata TaxID=392030 RepID=A0A815IZG8_9BILA|nr:unnamed protein product [Rotaria magnacalcarata]CAF1372342.1 unnamed protein product [Rotaria magnacalcarata]
MYQIKLHRNRRTIMYYYRYYAERNSYVKITLSVLTFIIFSFMLYLSFNHLVYVYQVLHLPGHRYISLNRETKTAASVEPQPQKLRGITKIDRFIKYHDFNYLKAETLTYEKHTYSNHIPILYRLPQKVSTSALLLIFHGCSRSANDWFHTIERQRIIGAAIDLGYGCLAFQATDEFTRCWSNDMDFKENSDAQMVFKGLEGFYKENPALENLPRFTFGSSSGGIFSSIFVTNQRYPIQGQILFISIILPEVLEKHVKKKKYPPTAWIYMPRDIEFASEQRINASMDIFARENIPHKSFDIEPIRVTKTTFYDRIPTIGRVTSRYIFNRFEQNHWFDSDFRFIHNPRRTKTWEEFLFSPAANQAGTAEVHKTVNNHKNIIPDFLNTIYGEHEISYERSYEALKWLHDIYQNKINSKT